MNIKALLYIFITPLVIWVLDGINMNSLFKKNRVYQASILYIILCLCLSYLVVNFFMDFFNYTKII